MSRAAKQQQPLPWFDPDAQLCLTCKRPVLEEGRLRHRDCPPTRMIHCVECDREYDGVVAFVDHFRNAGDGSGRTVCERLQRKFTVVVCGGE